MATYTAREVTTTIIEYEVPCSYGYGVAIAEFFKAFSGAKHQAEELGINTSYDDWCTVHPGDESVFIRFEKP